LSWIHIDIAKHKFVLDEKCLGKNIEKFDKIIFISKAILAIFGRVFPNIPENKFQCIYNPIDVELILKRGEEDTSFFATPKTGLRVLSMGRLAQMKRFDLLISACARLRKEGHAVELFIFGYGKEEAALKALITELGEDEFLKIMPYQENPYSLMRQADVFVSSSDYEGLPLVITEAMILGVPILATRTPGAEELLENGKYGALVGFSEKEIHDGLLGFLLNPTKLLDYRQNLLESRQNFPFNSSVSKIEELLEIEI
jgi:glycosyltransferase involved in cell wall biosynthesis